VGVTGWGVLLLSRFSGVRLYQSRHNGERQAMKVGHAISENQELQWSEHIAYFYRYSFNLTTVHYKFFFYRSCLIIFRQQIKHEQKCSSQLKMAYLLGYFRYQEMKSEFIHLRLQHNYTNEALIHTAAGQK